jgi:hypothetical protein
LCIVSVFCCFNKFVNYDGRRGDTAQALDQWRHPVASSEALDELHWAMRPTLYCCIAMAIKTASDLHAIFVAVDPLSPTTIANNIVIININ